MCYILVCIFLWGAGEGWLVGWLPELKCNNFSGWFFFSPHKMYLFRRWRGKERERERTSTCWLTYQMAVIVRARLGQSRGPRTPSGSPMKTGRDPGHLVLLSQMHPWEAGPEGEQPGCSHSFMGCQHPKQQLRLLCHNTMHSSCFIPPKGVFTCLYWPGNSGLHPRTSWPVSSYPGPAAKAECMERWTLTFAPTERGAGETWADSPKAREVQVPGVAEAGTGLTAVDLVGCWAH